MLTLPDNVLCGFVGSPERLVESYTQEDKSRMASCWEYDLVDMRRYSCAMEAEGLGMHLWRKSALWFTMPRRALCSELS